ncbi:class I SAM-dependent methyltransferase [Pelagovum pacificum]|uniref:Class I SAM-dependent methyltransferase n=1 Tax=Pelagovum pacificum TaxID=2588711 RepID=A0A5C5GDG5_9RHOB|nr:class I SAM-dependent methyltransferase [Pelagovum pacificum]QQA44167.1 class I SAM-dependent methyltransferase [Pelagovum pacificum]TNY32708.1 class I SAM-dependent methyltransferase [Pelagovum pacificum]
MTGVDVSHWACEAENWTAWARTPGHDAFWGYRPSLASFIGEGQGPAVEIGCGEGRVSRLLTELGYEVTAVEPVRALLDAAREAGSASAYVEAPAADLPFEDGAFGLVLLYNVLMDVEDLEAAATEAARVLAPGGRMVVGIVHPLADMPFAGEDEDCLSARRFDETEERGGLAMRFGGWARPMSHYVTALCGAGLVVTAMDEPRPEPSSEVARRWSKRPLFLWMSLTKG